MDLQCLYRQNSTGMVFQSAFYWLCKCLVGETVPMENSKLALGTLFCYHHWYLCFYLSFIVTYWSSMATSSHPNSVCHLFNSYCNLQLTLLLHTHNSSHPPLSTLIHFLIESSNSLQKQPSSI